MCSYFQKILRSIVAEDYLLQTDMDIERASASSGTVPRPGAIQTPDSTSTIKSSLVVEETGHRSRGDITDSAPFYLTGWRLHLLTTASVSSLVALHNDIDFLSQHVSKCFPLLPRNHHCEHLPRKHSRQLERLEPSQLDSYFLLTYIHRYVKKPRVCT